MYKLKRLFFITPMPVLMSLAFAKPSAFKYAQGIRIKPWGEHYVAV